MQTWKDRFDQGESLETVSGRDWTAHGTALRDAIAAATLPPEHEAFFAGLRDRRLTALILGMNGCGDCERYLPVIAAITRAAWMKVRAFDRDRNPDVMDLFLTDGKRRVPVLALFDGDREIARWIERPKAAEEINEAFRAKRPADDDPDREARFAEWRREHREALDRANVQAEAVREIREALEGALHATRR